MSNTPQRQREQPSFFIQGTVMSAIGIVSNEPKSRMINQVLKGGGRGMPINHIIITIYREEDSFNNSSPTN